MILINRIIRELRLILEKNGIWRGKLKQTGTLRLIRDNMSRESILPKKRLNKNERFKTCLRLSRLEKG